MAKYWEMKLLPMMKALETTSDEDDEDILDKIVNGVITVVDGVRGIFGPGGIFIP